MADPREGQHQDPQTLCIVCRGVVLPTPEHAALVLARQFARDIADGRIEPYDGARRLCTVAYEMSEADCSEMMNFVGFVSGIEDHPDSLAYYEPMIVREAGRRLGDAD